MQAQGSPWTPGSGHYKRRLVASWGFESCWSWSLLALPWLCNVRCQHEEQQRMDECIQQVLDHTNPRNPPKTLCLPTQRGVLSHSSGPCTLSLTCWWVWHLPVAGGSWATGTKTICTSFQVAQVTFFPMTTDVFWISATASR